MKRKFAYVAGILVLAGIFALPALSRADRPRLAAALSALQQAKAELEAAKPDKGGHRVAALQATNKAIAEVSAAIEYGRIHPGD